jgi:hypothetical protein
VKTQRDVEYLDEYEVMLMVMREAFNMQRGSTEEKKEIKVDKMEDDDGRDSGDGRKT